MQSQASEEEVHSKKRDKFKNNGSLGPMTIKQIQDLIINAIKPLLGGDARKTHLYTKPYTNGLTHSTCFVATNL